MLLVTAPQLFGTLASVAIVAAAAYAGGLASRRLFLGAR